MKKDFTFLLVMLMLGSINLLAQYDPADPVEYGLGKSYISPKISAHTVTIDGKADESFWAAIPWMSVDNKIGPGNPPFENPTAEDFSARAKLAWDSEALYLYYEMVDDILVQGISHSDGDNIEFMISFDSLWYDLPNRPLNTTANYQRANFLAARNYCGSQVRINYGSPDISGSAVVMDNNLVTTHQKPPVTNITFITLQTVNGWSAEARIPFNVLYNPNPAVIQTFQLPASEGARFVIDFQAVDVEVSGTRKHTLTWNSKSDQIWREARTHGWVTLGQEVAVNVLQKNADTFRMYPSLVTSQLTVELNDVQSVKSVSVMNIMGQQMMKSVNLNSRNVYSLDNLASGIYLLNVENTNGKVISKRFVKK